MTQNLVTRRWLANFVELLGSMRFAVSLLMFICIASLIGTVLDQNQVANVYIDRFGPFWYSLFDVFSIWHIYNSWWFLIIMAFLVVSTSLCLVRNTPKMLRDARSFREYVRASSLRAFPQRLQVESNLAPQDAIQALGALLRRQGYKYKTREDATGVMVAAKKGSANRLGYVFAHAAIVVICIGGLLDSELPVRVQTWLGGKQPIVENMFISEVPQSGRLSAANPSYRANMLLPEGSTSRYGIIPSGDGVLIQPLPFALRLKKFIVDYYPTGMPSSFKSEVEVIDPDKDEPFEVTIEVNEPLRYKGVAVYQSSFEDGGSSVTLNAWPLSGSSQPGQFTVDAKVGTPVPVGFATAQGQQQLELDVSGLRVINVENLDNSEPQPKAVIDHVAAVTGSAARSRSDNLRNVGPSVQYRVIGADGQSFEYNNYMLPMLLDDGYVFLAGVRQSEAENYRYLRFPADKQHSLNSFMQLRAGLNNPKLRALAAKHFAEQNAANAAQQPLLEQAASSALEAFASGGFEAIVERVPEDERTRFLDFALPMLQFSLLEVNDLVRAEQGLEPFDRTGPDAPWTAQWSRTALLALANLPQYPAPVFFTLSSFDQVEASVFQIARSPGKNTVYLGSLFLIIGVFSMFYIRDRRIWVWVRPEGQGTALLAAMTSQRRTLDFYHEFERFSGEFKQLSKPEGDT